MGSDEIRLFIKTNKQYGDCNAGIQGNEITTYMCTKGFIPVTAFVQYLQNEITSPLEQRCV